VAFVDRLFEVEIVEIGLDGRLLWYLPASGYRFVVQELQRCQ
jgi:hypothetical protein